MRSTFPKGENIEPFFCRTDREISDQSTFCTLFKTSEWIKNKGGQNISKPELEAFQRKQVCKKRWISSHRAPITVPQAQSPVLSAEQEVSIVSKAIFAIIAFKLAIAWSASFVSYPARLDPAC